MTRAMPLALALVVGFWSGCDDRPALVAGDRFQYAGYDSGGQAIVRGSLEITAVEAGAVSGQWQLSAIGTPQRIGPQVGSGGFAGFLEEDELRLDLNPQLADNNVGLNGTVRGRRYQGRWAWSTLPGVTNEGTFEATRQ